MIYTILPVITESYEKAMESAPVTKPPTDRELEEMALEYVYDGCIPDHDDMDDLEVEDYFADRIADGWS